MAKIGMACDHAGYELKEYLKKILVKRGNEVVDFGTNSPESMDYPDTAHPLAEALEAGKVDFGVSMCGSGNGITMPLNNHQKVRAALCWKPEIAALAKQHNNANILSMPARFISRKMAVRILDAYLDAKFEGGRHQRRIEKIPCK